jgi:hypothetical protein
MGTVEFSAFEVGKALVEQKKADAFRPFVRARERLEPFLFVGALNWQIRNAEKQGKIDPQRCRRIYEILLYADISLRVSSGKHPIEVDILRLLSA